jgi:AraC-like DNA-binding protein
LDVLSDVLRAVRLTGAVYFDINARAPWIAASPPTATICANVMPDFERVISFHIMLDGCCWAQLSDESEPAIKLDTGDAVIFVRGEPHVMASEPGKHAQPDLGMYVRPTDRPLPFIFNEFGGTGEKARVLCGYLGCDGQPFNPIVEALPHVMHVRSTSSSGRMIHELMRTVLQESTTPRAGGETILSKLSELMFLQAVRDHIETLSASSKGWLSGLRDRHVGAALALMHGRPTEAWTLDTLAKEVGQSRSAFAERFADVMGVPAMQYLGNWRLQLAARALERQGTSVAQAAAEVGYESEAAFNRAFKRLVGVPPGAWRRNRSAAARADA